MMERTRAKAPRYRLALTSALCCLTVALGIFACRRFDRKEAISADVQAVIPDADDASDEWRSALAWFGPDGDAADEQLANVAFRFRAVESQCTLSIHHNVCCVAVKPRDLAAARKLASMIVEEQSFAWVKTHLVHPLTTDHP